MYIFEFGKADIVFAIDDEMNSFRFVGSKFRAKDPKDFDMHLINLEAFLKCVRRAIAEERGEEVKDALPELYFHPNG